MTAEFIAGKWGDEDEIVCPHCGRGHGLPDKAYGDWAKFECVKCGKPFRGLCISEDYTDEEGTEHIDLIVQSDFLDEEELTR